MQMREPRLGIVYEHPEWFAPLFSELDRRGVAYDRIDLSRHAFDLAASAPPWTIVLNRMSPSAYLRGHGQTIVYALEFLRYLQHRGVDVINGAVVRAADETGVAVPLNRAFVALVKGWESMQGLAA